MGMFDSIKIKMKCPYCREISEIEAQTKDLECDLEVWKVGDFVTNKLNYLECLSDCPQCKEFFDIKIFLKGGKVSGDYEILN